MEGVFWQALELGEPDLGHAPEALDTVDVDRASGELVSGMIDTIVSVSQIDEAVIAAPAIGVDNGAGIDLPSDNALYRWL